MVRHTTPRRAREQAVMHQYVLKTTLLSKTLIAAVTHAGTVTTSIDSTPFFQIIRGSTNIGMLNAPQTEALSTSPAITCA